MSPDVSASAVLLVGVMLIRLVLSDVYQRYVRVGMGPWLLVAGVLLAALGAVMAARAIREPVPAGDDPSDPSDPSDPGDPGDAGEDGHRHGGGDRVGWLLLAPVLVLLLVAPPALGSFGVPRTARTGAGAVTVTAGAAVWAPLPAGSVPRPITLLELDQRAWDRSGASLAGVTLQLTGFVSDGSAASPSGFGLARYQIACCAADAVASVVRVVGVIGVAPARDGWATVVGTYAGTLPDGTPQIAATSVQPVPAPVDPYE